MASIPKPRVLSQRGKTQLEIDRENFERAQTAGIQKAVNTTETPVKEKHVRTAIIGTFRDHNAGLFWSNALKLPLQGHPIVCWKFCHVLHKLSRDGHHNVVKDSQRYSGYIADLGKLWGHLREGYGRLIAFYCKLLVQKLAFHRKNPEVPGNLVMEDEYLERMCGNDINSYFELSVDMLDYMDDILALQTQVFNTLDTSRANSMTSTGQCRLAPLIMSIQDSCQLYDYLVKILFRLHSSLPPDTLGGHRDRFYQQYRSLKQFYYHSSNLQYFKNLIKVPLLQDDPPNFLRASDLSSHVTPVAWVPEPEEDHDDRSEVDSTCGSTEGFLIDTTLEEPVMQETSTFTQNGAPSPPMPDDRDIMIQQLMSQINQLKQELASVRAEDQMVIESLQNRIREIEAELDESRMIQQHTTEENESLKTALQDHSENAEALTRLATLERQAKGNEEKFRKMKDIYNKLRDEHVALIRTNAETTKSCAQEKTKKKKVPTATLR